MRSLGDPRGLWQDGEQDPGSHRREIWRDRDLGHEEGLWAFAGVALGGQTCSADVGGSPEREQPGRGRCTDGHLSGRKRPKLPQDRDAEHSCADFPAPRVPWESS